LVLFARYFSRGLAKLDRCLSHFAVGFDGSTYYTECSYFVRSENRGGIDILLDELPRHPVSTVETGGATHNDRRRTICVRYTFKDALCLFYTIAMTKRTAQDSHLLVSKSAKVFAS
jgi:hypothetical protein